MPSALPTTDTLDKAVNTFGIGTYDSQRDSDGEHGEDSEKTEPEGKSLPEDGGPLDPFGPDRLLSYPQEYTSQGKHASAELPGEYDRPPSQRRINDDTLQSVIESVSQSELPSDSDNPPARSDYYDKLQTGGAGRTQDFWPTEDSGAYVSQEEKISDSELPTVNKNEETLDNYLNALGNYWSGTEIEDVSGPQGFPTEDFKENINYDRSDNQDGGTIMANSILATLRDGFKNMNQHLSVDCKETFWVDPFKDDYSGVKQASRLSAEEDDDVKPLTPGARAPIPSVKGHEDEDEDDSITDLNLIKPVRVDVREYKPVGKDSPYPVMDGYFEFILPTGQHCTFDGRFDTNDIRGKFICDGKDLTNKVLSTYDEVNETTNLDFIDSRLDPGYFTLDFVLEHLIKMKSGKTSSRTATDVPLVQELTKEFIKEFGKSNITRRHVMAFLTERGRPQYLASDIIRCLKHNHKLVIPDVLDTFPVAKTASQESPISNIREKLINLQLENILDPETSCEFGRCAADLSHAIARLERV